MDKRDIVCSGCGMVMSSIEAKFHKCPHFEDIIPRSSFTPEPEKDLRWVREIGWSKDIPRTERRILISQGFKRDFKKAAQSLEELSAATRSYEECGAARLDADYFWYRYYQSIGDSKAEKYKYAR